MTPNTSAVAVCWSRASRSSARSASICACIAATEVGLIFGEVRVLLFGAVLLAFFEPICFALVEGVRWALFGEARLALVAEPGLIFFRGGLGLFATALVALRSMSLRSLQASGPVSGLFFAARTA